MRTQIQKQKKKVNHAFKRLIDPTVVRQEMNQAAGRSNWAFAVGASFSYSGW